MIKSIFITFYVYYYDHTLLQTCSRDTAIIIHDYCSILHTILCSYFTVIIFYRCYYSNTLLWSCLTVFALHILYHDHILDKYFHTTIPFYLTDIAMVSLYFDRTLQILMSSQLTMIAFTNIVMLYLYWSHFVYDHILYYDYTLLWSYFTYISTLIA